MTPRTLVSRRRSLSPEAIYALTDLGPAMEARDAAHADAEGRAVAALRRAHEAGASYRQIEDALRDTQHPMDHSRVGQLLSKHRAEVSDDAS